MKERKKEDSQKGQNGDANEFSTMPKCDCDTQQSSGTGNKVMLLSK